MDLDRLIVDETTGPAIADCTVKAGPQFHRSIVGWGRTPPEFERFGPKFHNFLAWDRQYLTHTV